MNHRRERRGIALLQTMVMAVILAILAVAILRVVLGNQTVMARIFHSNKNRYWVEACLARKQPLWQQAPYNGTPPASDTCDFTASGGPIVNISVSGSSPYTVSYTVTPSNWK